jgi:hypothetical protein
MRMALRTGGGPNVHERVDPCAAKEVSQLRRTERAVANSDQLHHDSLPDPPVLMPSGIPGGRYRPGAGEDPPTGCMSGYIINSSATLIEPREEP